MTQTAEEEVAKDFICFGGCDVVIVICDATCLERNLNLVLQTMEITNNVVVCINLLDEAKKKQIKIDMGKLSDLLGVPVVGTSARSKKGLNELMGMVSKVANKSIMNKPLQIKYPESIEDAIGILQPAVFEVIGNELSSRWVSLKLLESDISFCQSLENYLSINLSENKAIINKLEKAYPAFKKTVYQVIF